MSRALLTGQTMAEAARLLFVAHAHAKPTALRRPRLNLLVRLHDAQPALPRCTPC